MIEHVLDRYVDVADTTVLVVDPAARSLVEAHVAGRRGTIRFAEQASPTGMLDAIMQGQDATRAVAPDRIWITWCDQVGISAGTVETLARLEIEHPGAAVIFPVVRQTPPYIHFDTDAAGRPVAVRQRREGDAMPETGLSDSGLFSLSAEAFTDVLPQYASGAHPGRGTGEVNFLPFLVWMAGRAPVITFEIAAEEAQGINTPDDLAAAERRLA